MSPSIEQRERAREKANAVRMRRAEAKRAVAALTLRPDDACGTDDPLLVGMKVIDLLRAVPGVGLERAKVMLAASLMTERTELRFVAASQRARLRLQLDRHYASSRIIDRALAA